MLVCLFLFCFSPTTNRGLLWATNIQATQNVLPSWKVSPVELPGPCSASTSSTFLAPCLDRLGPRPWKPINVSRSPAQRLSDGRFRTPESRGVYSRGESRRFSAPRVPETQRALPCADLVRCSLGVCCPRRGLIGIASYAQREMKVKANGVPARLRNMASPPTNPSRSSQITRPKELKDHIPLRRACRHSGSDSAC